MIFIIILSLQSCSSSRDLSSVNFSEKEPKKCNFIASIIMSGPNKKNVLKKIEEKNSLELFGNTFYLIKKEYTYSFHGSEKIENFLYEVRVYDCKKKSYN